jgi:S-methylmethionine-dependent homocysteine/selenocysteine methylase
MSDEGAEAYHAEQVRIFSDSAADLVTAITMNYVEEAIGIARAARSVGMPVVISFTVETDGRLPTRDTLQAAIERVDTATAAYPAYYMINCAHPTHFEGALDEKQPWALRLRGLRANASRQSHAELNESPTLDAGDPVGLGRDYAAIKRRLPRLNVMGGCCGTDHRHVEQIAAACAPLFR